MDDLHEPEPAPPGTVLLNRETETGSHIILQPQPTNDPNDPLNWSKSRKAIQYGIVLFYVLFTFVLIDIGGTAYEDYVAELGLTFQDYNIMTGLNYTGLAVGCIFFIPLAHKYGRRPVYILSLVLQLASAIWSAKVSTSKELIALNLIMGLGGAISEVVVQMTIADLFFVHQYATTNGLFLMMQTTGAYLGPVASGYVVVGQGWRWMWWWCAIFLAISLVVVIFFFEESAYKPCIDGEPESSASVPNDGGKKLDDGANVHAKLDTPMERTISFSVSASAPKRPLRQRLALVTKSEEPVWRHFYQPFILLFKFPAVAYTAITYGSLLAWFTIIITISSAYLFYPPWNFSAAGVGLFSIAPFIGSFLGLVCAPLSDMWVLRLAKKNNGIYEPEMRLYPAIPAAFVCAAGILIFGIGTAQGQPWIVLAIGFAVYGFGFSICCDISLSYLTDSYQNVIGDALVGVILMRNSFSIIISFSLDSWIKGMGLQNVFILSAVLALVILLIPIALLKWGKEARRRTGVDYRRYSLLQASRVVSA